MRKRINGILILLLLFVSSSYSQTNTLGEYNKFIAQNWSGEYYRVGQYKVRGTPFFLGESFNGTLTYKGGTKTDTKILYDLHNQKAGAEFKNNILESGEVVEEFTISLPAKYEGKTLVFKSSESFGDKSLKSYFNVLDDGTKVVLLKLFKVKLMPDPSNMMDKEIKLFEQYYEYYLYNKTTKQLSKIRAKEKDLAKQLGDEDFVKGYIAKSDLDVSQEVDLIKLVNGYNNK